MDFNMNYDTNQVYNVEVRTHKYTDIFNIVSPSKEDAYHYVKKYHKEIIMVDINELCIVKYVDRRCV